MKCGLLGRKLGHSYSPAIHAFLGEYSYDLFEVEPEDLASFLHTADFRGLNVTMPYKQAVIPWLDGLSDSARRLGAVNTILRQSDGTLLGHNTDYPGFAYLVSASGIPVAGKKALVLGSGGAAMTVKAVLEDLGAQVVILSRRGENHYGNLEMHSDARLLVNATPVGMYPDNGSRPVDLRCFPHLEGVWDLIYNPHKTALVLQAESLKIPAFSGLSMLICQAWEASKLFTGRELSPALIPRVYESILKSTQNLILIGMPGSGKTTVGRLLAQRLGRPYMDTDACIEEKAGISIPEIFSRSAEGHFRDLETQVLQEVCKLSGCVIACGGGVVTQPRNEDLLRQNATVIWLKRDLCALATQGRPLSIDLRTMYENRKALYSRFSQIAVDNNGTPEETVQNILEVLSL